MNSKRVRPVVFLLLTVVAAGLLAGFQYRRKEKARMEENLQAVSRLLATCGDTLRRHPEFVSAADRSYLLEYPGLPAREQARRAAELEDFASRLEMTVSYRSWSRPLGEALPEGLAGYRTYSPLGFKAAGDALEFPHAAPITVPPAITGSPEADRRLIGLAEQRGYRLRWAADVSRLEALGRHRLQPGALADWLRLQRAAADEGISLTLISAYRSPERQREIFLSLLEEEALRHIGRTHTPEEIASGEADGVIDTVLASSSIPGYSKHHSGCALDIGDLESVSDYTEFASSRGFAWLSADNYYNAKRFGFLPSYPEGAGAQGPDPEAWEYLWVGGEALLRADGRTPLDSGRVKG